MEGAVAPVQVAEDDLSQSNSGPSALALVGAVAVAELQRLVQTRVALGERVAGTVPIAEAWGRAQIWAADEEETWGFLDCY